MLYRALAKFTAAFHLAWMGAAATFSSLSLFLVNFKLSALSIIGVTLGSSFIFKSCPLTALENRIRHIVDKNFDISQTFLNRLFNINISIRVHRGILIVLFLIILFIGK